LFFALFFRFFSLSHPKENHMKLIVNTPKPRNPFVAAAMRRTAGSHRACTSARRQQNKRELRQELDHARHKT
jgi:hypothetical protein